MRNCKNKKDDLPSLPKTYKICYQNADQDIFKKQEMINVLTTTVAGLQESQQKLMKENKTLTMVNGEIISKSKPARPGTFPSKHKKIVTSL